MNYYYDRYLDEMHANNETDEFHQETTTTDDHNNDQVVVVEKPWGHVIGASLLVQIVTFSGLLAVGFCSCFQRLRKNNDPKSFWHMVHNQIIPSFASGALLATTVFLLIPEGFELLEGHHGARYVEAEHLEAEASHNHRWRRYLADAAENETDHHEDEEVHYEEGDAHSEEAAWKFGTALLGGFLFPIILNLIFPTPDVSNCEKCREREQEMASNLSPAALDVVAEEEVENSSFQSASENEQTTMDLNCDDGNCACHHDEETGQNATTTTTTKNSESTKPKEVKQKEVVSTTATATVRSHHERNFALASSILLGDFFHNFCDGIFLGTAFLLCSKTLAWTITATTIYHEVAQEIADYALLTHHCGLSRCQALTANFVAGFSVMIGAIIALSAGLSDTVIGGILVVSAGVYIYIAACECVPRIQAARRSARDTVLVVSLFIMGAVPIGLVLLNHGHCEAEH